MALTKNDLYRAITAIEEIEYELASRKLSFFVQKAWKVLEPGKPLLWNWHLDLICEELEKLYFDHLAGIPRRLIINIPPRNLKSTIVTVCFPAWVWLQRTQVGDREIIGAAKRFVTTSYSQSLSTKHSVDRRTLINSKWYQYGYGDRFRLTADQDMKMEYSNNKRGHCIATSMSGTATGKGGDILIVDDPHDTTIAESDAKRKTTLEDFDQKFTTRLDDKNAGAIIIVMQRLHEKDLTGHCLAQGGYDLLCLPAEAPEATILEFPRSGKRVVRNPGDILHPEREGPNVLALMKRALGSGYAGQYDQRPTSKAGGIIKREYIQFYKVLPDRIHELIQSWDFSFKDTKTSDKVSGQVWARAGASFFLVDRVNDRMGFAATILAIKALTFKHPKAHLKLYEDKANGPAIADTLKTKCPGLVPVEPMGSKEARLSATEPYWAAGNVYLPDPSIAPWVNDFIEELVNFPNAANDDDVDACSQALNRLGPSAGLEFTKDLNPSNMVSLAATAFKGEDQW
jgi:predicted phage terminase large subunit-like protein